MSKNKIVYLAKIGLNKSLGLVHHVDVEGGTIGDPVKECAFIVELNISEYIGKALYLVQVL